MSTQARLTSEEMLAGVDRESLGLTEPTAAVAAPERRLDFRTTSGRYRSAPAFYTLELRVDVDGRRPLRKLSGDYYQTSGATTSYYGSFTVDAVTVQTTPTALVVIGTARLTWQSTFNVAQVTIPRRTIFQPAAPATLRWSTSSGTVGATYVADRVSSSFRTVELEEDCESGVTPFVSYDTGSLPAGGGVRTLTVGRAYAEAGLQLLDTGGANVINTSGTHSWNDASLHHAMATHFSRWLEQPQFKVWLLHAMRHDLGSGLLGIMFDQQGLQRQGCASFYQSISSGTPVDGRTQLYVNVHELGHCFNLFHSFHKQYMTPPMPNRLDSLSWMNYPRFFDPGNGEPSGEAAFWAAFPFEFDDLELAHLRHGFRNDVIMGGNPFGTGAALTAGEFADRVVDTSGLRLRIKAADERPLLGTPVVLEINVIAERRQRVNRREQLHPKYGYVQLAISRPRGDVIVHQPPLTYCTVPDLVTSGGTEEQPTSAYIGYDARVGQVFEDPGTYRIRASYVAPDGSSVVSNMVTVRTTGPRSMDDERVADLMLTDQTGMALTLLGSDSPHLSEGTAALETVSAQYGDHPAALPARLALGFNAGRPFTAVADDGEVHVRERDVRRADEFLRPTIEASRGDGGLDDLTVYQAAAFLADCHEAVGDTDGARQLRSDIAGLARAKNAPPSVVESLER